MSNLIKRARSVYDRTAKKEDSTAVRERLTASAKAIGAEKEKLLKSGRSIAKAFDMPENHGVVVAGWLCVVTMATWGRPLQFIREGRNGTMVLTGRGFSCCNCQKAIAAERRTNHGTFSREVQPMMVRQIEPKFLLCAACVPEWGEVSRRIGNPATLGELAEIMAAGNELMPLVDLVH